MTGPGARQILETLSGEGYLDEQQQSAVAGVLGEVDSLAPWYVRLMVGAGAWLASLLLVLFLVSTVRLGGPGYLIVAIVFMVAGTFLRYWRDADFTNQMAIAVSLAGQALAVVWVAQQQTGVDTVQASLLTVVLVSVLMFGCFPDSVHRFLSVVAAMAAVTGLLYVWEVRELVVLVPPGLTAAFVVLSESAAGRLSEDYRQPLRNGILFSAFGAVMLSAFYLLPEFRSGATPVFPHPWISTLLLGAPFMWALVTSCAVVFAGNQRWLVAAAGSVVVLASLPAPGIVLALTVVLTAYRDARPAHVVAGVGFLALFSMAHFYGMEVSMLIKSISLMATGSVLLLARWLLLRYARAGAGAGAVSG